MSARTAGRPVTAPVVGDEVMVSAAASRAGPGSTPSSARNSSRQAAACRAASTPCPPAARERTRSTWKFSSYGLSATRRAASSALASASPRASRASAASCSSDSAAPRACRRWASSQISNERAAGELHRRQQVLVEVAERLGLRRDGRAQRQDVDDRRLGPPADQRVATEHAGVAHQPAQHRQRPPQGRQRIIRGGEQQVGHMRAGGRRLPQQEVGEQAPDLVAPRGLRRRPVPYHCRGAEEMDLERHRPARAPSLPPPQPPAVVGSTIADTVATLSAGKPPRRACSRTSASSSAR